MRSSSSSTRSDSPRVHHVPIFVESSGATLRSPNRSNTNRQNFRDLAQDYEERERASQASNSRYFESDPYTPGPKDPSERRRQQSNYSSPSPEWSSRGETSNEPSSSPSPQTPIPLFPPPRHEQSQTRNNIRDHEQQKTTSKVPVPDTLPSVIPLPPPPGLEAAQAENDLVKTAKIKSIPLPPPPEHSSFARPSQRSNVAGSHVDISERDLAFTLPEPPHSGPVPEPAPLWKTKIEVKGEPQYQATRCWVTQDKQPASPSDHRPPTNGANQTQSVNLKNSGVTNDSKAFASSASYNNQESREKEKENMNVILAVEKIKIEIDALVNQIHNFTGTSSEEKDYRHLDEMLTRCMLKLDTLDCLNQDRLRQTRKLAIKQVNDAINLLEARVRRNAAASRLSKGV